MSTRVVSGDITRATIKVRTQGLAHGFTLANFRPAFIQYVAGSTDPYVFGSRCKFTSEIGDWLPSKANGGAERTILLYSMAHIQMMPVPMQWPIRP